MFERQLKETINMKLAQNDRVIILYGPRQAGKTTLANAILKETGFKTVSVLGDEIKIQKIFSSQDYSVMEEVFHGYDCLFIDEAQKIPNIGINLKIIHDKNPKLRILVTGSSSLELADTVNEALTGRKWTLTLFPISIQEIARNESPFEIKNSFHNYMIYGMYPEILTTKNTKDKIEKLKEITTSYLYKDILELENIKYAKKIDHLLKLIAFQIGNQISLNELASNLDLNKETVSRYINLLEKSFVLFRLTGFSRNLRKEVTKSDKLYFMDLGIRNALIGNFHALNERNDSGALWENFVIIERLKHRQYTNSLASPYFWRTYTGGEIDYIEENANQLNAYEIKLNKTSKAPKSWTENYPNSSFTTINQASAIPFFTETNT